MREINRKKMKEKIQDTEVLKAYSKYETYLRELSIYAECITKYKEGGKVSSLQLKKMYKENGLDTANTKIRFQNFISKIKQVKKQNSDISLTDISTLEGRIVISDIISETQQDKEFKAADLFDVALAENLSLYAALQNYNEKIESKEEVLVHYDLTEQQFDSLQEKYQNYKKSGIGEEFGKMCQRVDGKIPSNFINYAAAALEDRPVNALEALRRIGIVEKDEQLEKYNKEIEVYPIAEITKDLIRKNPNIKNPEEEINRLEVEAYEKRLAHAKRLAIEADGKANVTLVGENISPKRIVVDPDIKRASGGNER